MRFQGDWRGVVQLSLLAFACLTEVGCRHKQVAAVPPIPPPQQLPVDTTAHANTQPLIPAVPIPPVPLTQVDVPKKKVKKPKRSTPATVAPSPLPAPVQVAGTSLAPEANVIGALTPGGSDTPERQREADNLISTLERRIAALPQQTKDALKLQLMQVRNFQRDAQAALRAGDSEGAVTLATKAKLLLDDLVK